MFGVHAKDADVLVLHANWDRNQRTVSVCHRAVSPRFEVRIGQHILYPLRPPVPHGARGRSFTGRGIVQRNGDLFEVTRRKSVPRARLDARGNAVSHKPDPSKPVARSANDDLADFGVQFRLRLGVAHNVIAFAQRTKRLILPP